MSVLTADRATGANSTDASSVDSPPGFIAWLNAVNDAQRLGLSVEVVISH